MRKIENLNKHLSAEERVMIMLMKRDGSSMRETARFLNGAQVYHELIKSALPKYCYCPCVCRRAAGFGAQAGRSVLAESTITR